MGGGGDGEEMRQGKEERVQQWETKTCLIHTHQPPHTRCVDLDLVSDGYLSNSDAASADMESHVSYYDRGATVRQY